MFQNDETKWFCIECSKEIFSFSSLNGVEFFSTIQGKKIKKLLTNEEKLINQFNDATNSSDFTNPSTYYSIDKFNKCFVSTTELTFFT